MRMRVLILAVALTAGAMAAANAQYDQFPGVPPPVPSPNSPPMIAPGPAAPSAMPRTDQPRSQLVPRRGRPPVEVPRGETDSFGDRATRCMHYGAAAGVPAKEIGSFTRECAN